VTGDAPLSPRRARERIYEKVFGEPVRLPPDEEEEQRPALPEPWVDELARLYAARGYLLAAMHLLALARAYLGDPGLRDALGRVEEELQQALAGAESRINELVLGGGRRARRPA